MGADPELLDATLEVIGETRRITERDIEVTEDYAIAVQTVLKRKSFYPMKPGGLKIYLELLEIKKSLENFDSYESNDFVKELLLLVSNALLDGEEYFYNISIAYRWIYAITKSLNVAKKSEQEAKNSLLSLIDNFNPGNFGVLWSWKKHIKKTTLNWLNGLYQYLLLLSIPRTNNDLEVFNGVLKKAHRKITGRKKSQEFVARYGECASIALSLPCGLNLEELFSMVSYEEFRNEFVKLTANSLRKKKYKIKHNLNDFLYELEIKWSNRS